MDKNTNDMAGRARGLLIYSIVCFVVLFGGLACSYAYWKSSVDGQFGLFILFTFLIFILINLVFKIPALVDIVLLAIYLSRSVKLKDAKSRNMSIVLLVSVIVSALICIIAEFIMFLSTQGSSLG
jgi:hypothetical protein